MTVLFWIIISDASSISDKSGILAWATQNFTEEVMVKEEVSYSMVVKKQKEEHMKEPKTKYIHHGKALNDPCLPSRPYFL